MAAANASLAWPLGVTLDHTNNLIITDSDNCRIRKVATVSPQLNESLAEGKTLFVDNNGLGYQMSSSGHHEKTLDLETGVTLQSFTYDSEKKLVFVTDQFGNSVTIERLADGTPSAIISPDGLRTVLHIDTDNHLRQIVYPDDTAYDFSYTSDGLMTTEIEPNGNRFDHIYDENGRVSEVLDEEGGQWQYFRQVLASGEVQIDSITAEGNRTTNIDHTFSNGSFTTTTIDPSDDQSLYRLSSNGLDEEGTTSSGMGTSTKYGLDPENLFITTEKRIVTTPSGISNISIFGTIYEDTNLDEISDKNTKSFTVNGKTTTLTHDVLSASRSITSPIGRTIVESYSPSTLQTTNITVPGLYPSSFNYDLRGRLTSVTSGTRQASFAYNAQGFLESSTDPLYRTTYYSHDPVGKVTSVTRPDSSTVYFTYDANGNMTVLTNPTSVGHGFTYNTVNRQTGYQTPLSGNYSYVYDRDRRLTQINFPSGYIINNIYDRDRLSQTQTPEGNIDFTYLSGDRVSTITIGAESLGYGYDGSLVTSETTAGTLNQTLSYTYNNDFNIVGLGYAGYTDSLNYDDDDLLTGIGAFTALPQNLWVDFRRNRPGQLPG